MAPPPRSSSLVACFLRTHPQPLCQTEATPPYAPEHTLTVSIKSSNVPVIFFLINEWHNTHKVHEQIDVFPPLQSHRWLKMNTQQKRAFSLWDKGAAKAMQRMAAPNECERGAAEWTRARTMSCSIRRLRRKAAYQNERNCQHSENDRMDYEWCLSGSDWRIKWMQGFRCCFIF